MMGTQKIYFPERKTPCVFPSERSELGQATSELHLRGRYPVIVLIGGEIDEQQADATRRGIQTIARTAEDINAVVIFGGKDMGGIGEIGPMRGVNAYKFPIVA